MSRYSFEEKQREDVKQNFQPNVDIYYKPHFRLLFIRKNYYV